MMEDKGRLMKYSTFLNSAILELFMFSFSGNGLIDEVSTIEFHLNRIILSILYTKIMLLNLYGLERRDRRVGIQQWMDRQPFPSKRPDHDDALQDSQQDNSGKILQHVLGEFLSGERTRLSFSRSAVYNNNRVIRVLFGNKKCERFLKRSFMRFPGSKHIVLVLHGAHSHEKRLVNVAAADERFPHVSYESVRRR